RFRRVDFHLAFDEDLVAPLDGELVALDDNTMVGIVSLGLPALLDGLHLPGALQGRQVLFRVPRPGAGADQDACRRHRHHHGTPRSTAAKNGSRGTAPHGSPHAPYSSGLGRHLRVGNSKRTWTVPCWEPLAAWHCAGC